MKAPKKKPKSRRNFLKNAIKAGATIPLTSMPFLSSSFSEQAQNSFPVHRPTHPLKILILGGTSFLGPHQIAYALNRGHSISIFTRGKTKPSIYKNLYKNVEHLVGDREDNLEALKGRKWDAVIDNSGYRVHWTKKTAELLRDNVDLYLYTSSTGVYYPYFGSDIQEATQLVLEVPEGINEEQKLEYNYGVMKANSELEAKKVFGETRTIIVRPTYMSGPADKTDRFVYWPVRLHRGGEVMVPGKKEDPVQFIDVRDVSEWMIRLIENRQSGTFNAVGPSSAMNMQGFIYGAHAAFSSPISFVQIEDYEFLKKQNVHYIVPWIMPTGDNKGSALVNNQHGIANGLTFTPLAKTVRDLFDWWNSDAVAEERREKLKNGPDSMMAREKSILEAWKNNE